jgi:oligopeptide/dipeptide ABC transporter ATP-binding protein
MTLTAEPFDLRISPSDEEPATTTEEVATLQVRDLTTEFRTRSGRLRAVDAVSLDVRRGRALAIIGESGSGKSALLRSIVGLLASNAEVRGQVRLEGRDLLVMRRRDREAVRGRKVAMVFQDPLTALDPTFTVERQLTETLRRHLGLGKAAAKARALELLEAVQIPCPEERLQAYPFELSGGMRQRVLIAMALACEPVLLLADEPTTALDVTVQARVLRLIRDLQTQRNMAMILVTHDLAVAARVADDVAVMYAGRLVEVGPVAQVVSSPSHPYTRGLLEANVQPGQKHAPRVITGAPPNLLRLPDGCAFAPRCPSSSVACWDDRPTPLPTGVGRWAACHHPDGVAAGSALAAAAAQP